VYWCLRNSLGQFCTAAGWNRSRLLEQHAAWRAYLEARRDRAEAECRGHLLTRSAWARGVSVARLFLPGASLASASEELRDWFAENGSTLTRRQFIAA
jgi:hypothetical protein